VAAFIRPFLVKRDSLRVESWGVCANMHDRQKARELISPLIDLMQELAVPRGVIAEAFVFTARGRES
jgi:hypothetical protein